MPDAPLDSYHQMRERLLARLVAGEIDQPTYDRLLEEVQRQQSKGTAPKAAGDTANPQVGSPMDSVGQQLTVARAHVGLEAGQSLGNYCIEQRLGRGGMGEVWKAYNATEERHVVVKIVPPEIQYHEEEVIRLKDSFKVIHELQHPHICPVYVLADDPRVGLYLVMRYIDGVTLSKYRRQYVAEHGSISLQEVCRLLWPRRSITRISERSSTGTLSRRISWSTRNATRMSSTLASPHRFKPA